MIFVGYTLPTFHFSVDPKLSTISYMCTDQFSFGCVCSVSNCSHGSLFCRKWFKRNRRNDDIVDKDLLYNLTFVSFSCLSYTIQYLVMMLIKLEGITSYTILKEKLIEFKLNLNYNFLISHVKFVLYFYLMYLIILQAPQFYCDQNTRETKQKIIS